MNQAWKTVLGGACGLLVAIGLAGCASDKGPVATIEGQENAGLGGYDIAERMIAENDKTFLKQLKIVGKNVSKTAGGLLEVQVRLQNVAKDTLTVEYCFAWTDERKMEMQTPSSRWLIRLVAPGDTVFLSGVAPGPKAKDFYIKLRRG